MSQRFLFVGVSTGASAVQQLFPAWCEALGVDWAIEGVDIPLGAERSRYSDLVNSFRDIDVVGGLVTTHKAALYRHQSEEFGLLEKLCESLGEIGLVYKETQALCGGVSDVTSGGVILEQLLTSPAWITGSRVAVIIGAGGAGLAAAWNLSCEGLGSPERVVLVEVDSKRRQEVEALVGGWPIICDLETVGDEADEAVLASGEAPLIINATGMGKDRPGSPVSIPFPPKSTVWEFNYRGELPFLTRALAEATEGQLEVVDGLRYFAAGWSVVMSKVARLTWEKHLFEQYLAIVESSMPNPSRHK